MKLIKTKIAKAKKKDGLSKEECIQEINKALTSMRPGMDKISKTIKQLRTVDKNLANDKQIAFNKLTNWYYELGSM